MAAPSPASRAHSGQNDLKGQGREEKTGRVCQLLGRCPVSPPPATSAERTRVGNLSPSSPRPAHVGGRALRRPCKIRILFVKEKGSMRLGSALAASPTLFSISSFCCHYCSYLEALPSFSACKVPKDRLHRERLSPCVQTLLESVSIHLESSTREVCR